MEILYGIDIEHALQQPYGIESEFIRKLFDRPKSVLPGREPLYNIDSRVVEMLVWMIDPDQALRPSAKACFNLLQTVLRDTLQNPSQPTVNTKTSRKMSVLSRFSIEGLESSAGHCSTRRLGTISSKHITAAGSISGAPPKFARSITNKAKSNLGIRQESEGVRKIEISPICTEEAIWIKNHVIEEGNLESAGHSGSSSSIAQPQTQKQAAQGGIKILPISSRVKHRSFDKETLRSSSYESPGQLLRSLKLGSKLTLVRKCSMSQFDRRSSATACSSGIGTSPMHKVLLSGRRQFSPAHKLPSLTRADTESLKGSLDWLKLSNKTNSSRVQPETI